MPLTGEPEYMWPLAWGITLAFTLIGIAVVAWILRRQSRTRGAIRAYLIGLEGVDAGPKAMRGVAEPRGHLTTDTIHAREFVTAFRIPGARARLILDDCWVPLTSRGTNVLTMLVAADERTGKKVHRIAARARRRDTTRGAFRVNPEMGDREAGWRFVDTWYRSRGAIAVKVGAHHVTLTRQGAEIVIALLLGSHRTVDRIAEALGSEQPMGWADWLPSDRVENDVTRDSYLDAEGEYWPDSMRPLGDKQRRYRA